MPSEIREPQAETLCNPQDMLTGHPLPTRAHTFTGPEGKKFTVLLQGISYARKSELDAARRMDLAEAQRRNEAKTDLYLPNGQLDTSFGGGDGKVITGFGDQV